MKKRILSICLCLMLSVMSIFVLSACKEKPKNISRVEAEEAMQAAQTTMQNVNAIKIESDLIFMKLTIFASANTYYSNALGFETWGKKEGDIWYEYSTFTITVNDEEITTYEKKRSLNIFGDGKAFAIGEMEDYPFASFLNATKLDDEINVTYEQKIEGITTKITYKIVSNRLVSISVGVGSIVSVTNIYYNEEALKDVPTIPTNVTWDLIEINPYLEVTGLKDEYIVGEQLDLSDVVLELFEDEDDFFSFEELSLSESMITGFSTETAGEFEMTITYKGVTLQFAYTVIEPVVE